MSQEAPQKAPLDPIRITSIEIDGLFRQYHHRIPLNQQDRVTVLHGRNGVGKTATLQLVAALFSRKLSVKKKLLDFPFQSLRVDFSDHSFLEARPSSKEDEALEARISVSGKDPEAVYFKPGAPTTSTALTALRKRVRVQLVDTQRLVYLLEPEDESPRMAATVESMAKDMAGRVQKANAEYKDTSTRLDNNLPARLFAPASDASEMPKEELDHRVAALEQERNRLSDIGLIAEGSSFNPSALNAAQRAMFAAFLKIEEEKLAVFSAFANRAKILLDIMNRKLAPKRIVLDPENGYNVFTHDGISLPLEALSSGEQHELVLLHTLLFKVEPGTLLLLDEPELSLHVTWQTDFLPELIDIAKLVGFDVIVATHSPYIVGERRDLMVQLGAPI